MVEIKLYKSPAKSIKLFLISSIFVLPCSYLIFVKEDNSWKLWFPLYFFGLGYVLSIFNIIDRREQIVINKIGIWDRTTKLGLIKWEMIKEFYGVEIRKQKFISVVADEKITSRKKTYKWASYLNQKLGAQDINLNISQLKVNAEKMLTLINILKDEPIEKREQVIMMYKDRL